LGIDIASGKPLHNELENHHSCWGISLVFMGLSTNYNLVGGINNLEKYEFVNGKDYPIYYGKIKMFETTNQIAMENHHFIAG